MSKLIINSGTISGSSFKKDAKILEVQYNPTEYSVSSSNTFAESKIPGLSGPIIQFSQGNAQSISLELLLDTQFSDSPDKEDIRDKYITPLEKLMTIDSDLHAPPHCQVLWGSLDFKGVLESLEKKYTLFSNDGKPVRARVTLKIKEYIPLGLMAKNPPLNSPDRRKLYTMKQGDSIWQMAYTAYGDPGLWRVIADANKIDNPLKIENGRNLIIPVLNEHVP